MAQGKVQLTCPYCGYQDEEREFAYSDFEELARNYLQAARNYCNAMTTWRGLGRVREAQESRTNAQECIRQALEWWRKW